jgi:hypothetical protein
VEESVELPCPHCGAPTVVFVDPGNGTFQEYVEDCQVCCRPNVITVRFERGEPIIGLRAE